MKTLYSMVFCLVITICFQVVGFAQCDEANGKLLNGNSVAASIYPSGNFFNTPEGDAGFIPNYYGGTFDVATIFSGGIWLGAIGEDEKPHTSVSTYGWSTGNVDFVAGPIDPSTGNPWQANATCELFNKVWKVQGYEILELINDFEDNDQMDNEISENIKGWPSRGNPYFEEMWGVAAPDFLLAPFFDRNENGTYEPDNGEYPIIGDDLMNVIPSELLWTVFNDQVEHMQSGSSPLNVEIQMTAWVFECSEEPLLNESVFTRHKVTNYNYEEDLQDFRMSLWLDPDVGCFDDDFVGCNPDLNTSYFYNADAVDGNNGACAAGVNTFAEEPPVQAMTILNQEMRSFSYYANAGLGGQIAAITDPNTATEYYNYLDAKWRDGVPMTVGNNGYDLEEGETTSFAFFDNPNDENGWSQLTSGQAYSDFRTLSTIGQDDFLPGTIIQLDAVYSIHRFSQGSDYLSAVNAMEEEVPAIQAIYDGGFAEQCLQLTNCEGTDCVWPGDANNDGIANFKDLLSLGIAIGNRGEGASRASLNTSWRPNTADAWATNLPDATNYKHTDFNGDGKTNWFDLSVLENNYGLQTINYNPMPQAPVADGEIVLSLSSSKSLIDYSLTGNSRLIPVQIHLNTQETQIYGIAMRVDFPAETIESDGFSLLQTNNLSFLSTGYNDIMVQEMALSEGHIDLAICHDDLMTVSGNDRIATFNIRMDNTFATPNEDGTYQLPFIITDVHAINAEGESISVSAEPFSIAIENVPYDETLVKVKELDAVDFALQISPNPSNGTILLDTEYDIRTIQVLNTQGQIQTVINNISKRETLQLPRLSAGLYFLRCIDANGRVMTKRLILE